MNSPAFPAHAPVSPREETAALNPPEVTLASEKWLRGPRALLVFVLAALAAYAPVLGGGLVWDDYYLVGENPFFRSPIFGWEVFRHYLFFDSFSHYYRPVQNWSYQFDYWLWHGFPAGYHLTNVLLHGCCGGLLGALLTRLAEPMLEGRRGERERLARWLGFGAALLWLVHPVHNAAVAYISGRADSLAALFAMAAWLLLLRAREAARPAGRWLGNLLAAALMLIALCAKEIALVWLVLFAGYELVFDRVRSWPAKLSALAGALGVLGCYALLHALPAARAAMEDGPPAAWPARVLLMLRALGDYASLLFWPGRLTMERTLSDPLAARGAVQWAAHARGEWLSVLGLAVILLATHGCRSCAPGQRLRRLGTAWFFAAFLPISNLFPLNAEVAEHWIYLASIGFFLVLAGWAAALPPHGRRWAAAGCALAIFALAVRTAFRADDWKDAETFYQQTLAAGGASPRILSALAATYGQRGAWAQQEKVLRRTIELYPDFPPARMNLGICLSRQGRPVEAETHLAAEQPHAEETARRYPRTWPAALNLARLRAQAGHREEALAMVREVRGRFPEIWEVAKYESELARGEGGAAAAAQVVEPFAAARWWHLDSWMTLGLLRQEAGDLEGAAAALTEAGRLDLYDPRPFSRLAAVELARHRGDAALAAQFEAMSRDPDRPGHYVELAELLGRLGREPEANAATRKALQLAAEKK